MANVNGTTTAYPSNTNTSLNTQRASGVGEVLDAGGRLAVTTTNINVFSNGSRVGFIQSFAPSEQRTITKLQEIGSEGVIQSVPSNTTGGQLSVSRFALYNSNLFNALGLTQTGQFVPVTGSNFISQSASTPDSTYNTYGNPFRTLKDQRVPLEIRVKTNMPTGTTSASHYIETYVDCWLANYQKSIAAQTITVTESATIQYSDVFASFVTES